MAKCERKRELEGNGGGGESSTGKGREGGWAGTRWGQPRLVWAGSDDCGYPGKPHKPGLHFGSLLFPYSLVRLVLCSLPKAWAGRRPLG